MLNSVYVPATQRLLQNPLSPTSLYATADLNAYINTARGQIAGEYQCIQAIGTLPTVVGQRAYNFSAINFGTPAVTGIQGAINVSRVNYNIGTGQQWIPPRPWPWFDLYYVNNVNPVNGPPKRFSQLGQGAAPPAGAPTLAPSFGGTLWIDPPPDQVYTLNVLCSCFPQTLAQDTDVEALPFLWSDAVSFFAAWYALLSSQTSARVADAEKMFGFYKQFAERARMAANPDVNRWQSQGAGDPAQAAKLGLQTGPGGQG